MEEWRTIKDFENYEISNMGRVRSLPHVVTQKRGNSVFNVTIGGKYPTLQEEKGGYLRVALCTKGKRVYKYVHRLVASAFIPNPENKDFVDHINTDRKDNRVENLRWVTRVENANNPLTKQHLGDACRGKKQRPEWISKRANARKKEVGQFDLKGNLIKVWSSAIEAADEGFLRSCISKCCKGIKKTHKGYKWKHLN